MILFVTGGCAQGKSEYVRGLALSERARIHDDYHLTIRRLLEEGLDPLANTEALLSEKADIVFIMNEVGSGIVPIGAKEREYREAVGRTGCLIAERADEVVRMIGGIPVRIK